MAKKKRRIKRGSFISAKWLKEELKVCGTALAWFTCAWPRGARITKKNLLASARWVDQFVIKCEEHKFLSTEQVDRWESLAWKLDKLPHSGFHKSDALALWEVLPR